MAAQKMFTDVMSGAVTLKGVSLPPRIGVVLQTRKDSLSTPHRVEIKWDLDRFRERPGEYRREFEQHVLLKILASLQTSSSIELDFGDFGCLTASAVASPVVKQRLARRTASALQWAMIVATSSSISANYVPVPELTQALVALVTGRTKYTIDESEKTLATRLSLATSWPISILPQLRELANMISK
jgi:hypothetical protein